MEKQLQKNKERGGLYVTHPMRSGLVRGKRQQLFETLP
jgi:hypothetical protein